MLTFTLQSDAAIVTLSAVLDGSVASATQNPNDATRWSLNPANLADGAHIYTITVIDANNNPGNLVVPFTNDLTSNPAITLDTPTNDQDLVGPSVTISGTFSGVTQARLGSLVVKIDGVPVDNSAVTLAWSNNGNTYSATTNLSDGWHYIEAILTSGGGQSVSATPISINVFIQPPFAFSTSANAYNAGNGNVYYKGDYLVASMPNGAEYWPSLLTLTNTDSSYPYSFYYQNGTWTYVQFGDGDITTLPPSGVYTANVTFNSSDYTFTTATQQILIDSDPPQFTYSMPPDAETVLQGPTAILLISDPPLPNGLPGSGINPSSINVYDANTGNTVPFNWNGSGVELDGLANGTYNFYVTAADNLGNGNTSLYNGPNFNWTFTVNRPTPYLAFTSPADGAYLYNPNPQIQGSANSESDLALDTGSLTAR